MPRMLGRYPSPACWCLACRSRTEHLDKRRRKRIEQRQVRREVAALLAERHRP